jgi:acyl carrier protein
VDVETAETLRTVVTLDMAKEAVRAVIPARRRDRTALSAETRFEEDLGFTSLDVGEVFVRLEALAGQPLDSSRVEHTKTVGDLLLVELADEDRAW